MAKKPTARQVRDEATKNWNSDYRGWDLGTLPPKAHREIAAIDKRYADAVATEKTRVKKATVAKAGRPAAKAAPKSVKPTKRSLAP